jgi:thymidylate kinase
MKIDLTPHGRPGVLLAICGFDGSGKSTLEAALLDALAAVRPSVPAAAPTVWWRQDANVQRTLYGTGAGRVLTEEALLHFNLADCHVHQSEVVLPALARGDLVVGTRYLFDMLALFEARGLTLPAWLPDAVARIVRPDFCFVLDGSAELFVDRIVRRDGSMPGRFDQDVMFVERYNAALRRMAEANGLTVLRADAPPGELLRQCLDVVCATDRRYVDASS